MFFKYDVRNKRTSIMDGGDEMIHGLSEEEKFKVIRPMLGEHMLGDYSNKKNDRYYTYSGF